MHRFNSIWTRALVIVLVLVTLMPNVSVAAKPAATPRLPAVGEVLINEFVAVNGTVQTSEWVELYNTTTEALTIGSMWIDDIAGGGGAPKQIPANTILNPGSYYVMDMSNYLNNTGDDVRLLGTNGTTVYDTYTYGSTSYDRSYCRRPNGGAWASNCTATKGLPNQ